ncbi:t-SNARE affecting a late Golgi compartment protein 2 [Vermiconidia calcicola]|uniref:t-SNARE affecting a late Golgi compartment protein 2 n=1 Tax=Vermiconidia calcicola TaxID=1690605 RepID=A0ACC3N6N2_9PEZI|nr:t-SNARE affecting a late Golgi compartment protein 2 [Vermiconidia calcicola]
MTTTSGANVGAWRDRTNLFISYRQSYTHHPASKRSRFGNGAACSSGYRDDADSERAGLMSNLDSDGDAVIEMDLLPPRWLDIQDEITQHLSDIAGKMKKLDQLHAKHVLPGFDDESVKLREEREIEGLTQEVTRGFSSCQRAIKRIDTMLRQQQTSQADEKMAKNLQISLATRVGETSTLFRKKQAAYLKKLRSLGGMSSPLPGRSGSPSLPQNPYTDPAMQEQEADRSSAQSTLQQTAQVQRRRTGVMDSAIEQREREIEKIAQGVIDLSNIFQELNSMVIDQGSLLDRIDYNVERTAEHTKEAEKELKVATKYQKRGTKRMMILLLVLLVVGMFILLLIKPKKSGGDGGKGAPGAPAVPGDGLPPTMLDGVVGERRTFASAASRRARADWKKRRRRPGGNGLSFMPV